MEANVIWKVKWENLILLYRDGKRNSLIIQKRISRLEKAFNKNSLLVQALTCSSCFRRLMLIQNNCSVVDHPPQSQVKLPISTPTFSGKYTEWTSIYDTFTSLIHKNPEISEIQKFQYLKSALKGEGAQLITSK